MSNKAKELSDSEREQAFLMILQKASADLNVKLKVRLKLETDNRIIPTLYIVAEKSN